MAFTVFFFFVKGNVLEFLYLYVVFARMPVDNSSDPEICTAEVAPSPYIDVATFFEEYVLENSKQEDFYFETHVAGFTIKDSLVVPGGLVVTGWYSNQVSFPTMVAILLLTFKIAS